MSEDLDFILRGGVVVTAEGTRRADIAIGGGRIAGLLEPGMPAKARREIAVPDRYLLPGLVDAHVHLREPGMTHKEDFASGTRAAIAGGVTTVLVMPTDEPWTSTVHLFREKQALASGRIYADVGLQVAVGRDFAELRKLRALGAVSFELFTADVPTPFLHDSIADLVRAMQAVAEVGGLAAVSPGDQSILAGTAASRGEAEGSIADFLASRPPLAEAGGIARAVLAAASTGARVHVRQSNSALGIATFRRLKSLADVSIETTPQSLLLTAVDYERLGPLLKASPPLRSPADVAALQEALVDGTIDIVATDHAPHSMAEKLAPQADFAAIPGGMPGLQTLLPVMLHLVDRGVIALPDVVRLCATTPASRFGLSGRKGSLRPGLDADILVLDPSRRTIVRNADQLTKPGYTPFDGLTVASSLERVFLHGVEVLGLAGIDPAPHGCVLRPTDAGGYSADEPGLPVSEALSR